MIELGWWQCEKKALTFNSGRNFRHYVVHCFHFLDKETEAQRDASQSPYFHGPYHQ